MLNRRVFARRDLHQLFDSLQADGTVPERTSLSALLDVLETEGELRECRIDSVLYGSPGDDRKESAYRPFRRYIWGEAPPLEVALSLRPRSYLSHTTAMELHGLSSPGGRVIYVNQEQTAKPAPTGSLTQSAIDRAFQNRARASQYVFRYEATDFVLVNGKQSGNLGVIPMPDASGIPYPTTHLERTLIDITVRPGYAGGVAAVLEAYRRAWPRLSIPTLVDTLARLAYVYPYHHAIGFYLERAGATHEETAPLRGLGGEYDFYLAHQMDDPVRDAAWRVYYPRDLE